MGESAPSTFGASASHDLLNRTQRGLLAACGTAGLLTGAVATFVTDNSVGTGVLLGIGGLLLFVGITGRAVSRARFGDSEVEFGARQALHMALDVNEPAVQESVAEAIVTSSLPPADPLRQKAELIEFAAAYQQSVSLALSRLYGDESVRAQHRHFPDFVVCLEGGHRRVGVEVKTSRSGRHVRRRIEEVVASLARSDLDGVVMVTNSATPKEVEHAATFGLVLVVWTSEEDDAALAAAVENVVVRKTPT